MKRPWHREPGESAQAYRAFRCYLRMGRGRSLARVGRKLYPGTGTRRQGKTGRLESWSVAWHWRARVAAWESDRFDRELAGREIEAVEHQTREAAIQVEARRLRAERVATAGMLWRQEWIKEIRATLDEINPRCGENPPLEV